MLDSLAENGYHEVHPGTYRHESRKTILDLTVDDFLPTVFGTDAEKKDNAMHLITSLTKYYPKVDKHVWIRLGCDSQEICPSILWT